MTPIERPGAARRNTVEGDGYDLSPHYELARGHVDVGHAALVDDLQAHDASLLAIDGPAALDWETFVAELLDACRKAGLQPVAVDLRDQLPAWSELAHRSDRPPLRDDPDFAYLCDLTMDEFIGVSDPVTHDAPLTVIFGPGAALYRHDRLWYAAVSKQATAEAVAHGAPNLGQPPAQAGSLRRLTFVDWPVQDRHVALVADRTHRYVDVTDSRHPRSVDGANLRESLQHLAARPFRTRPIFLPGVWGGQWMRSRLGVPTDAPNLAWSYELITPESGVLLGDETTIEVGFEWLMAVAGPTVVGPDVTQRFGASFPIRFDYLDTLEGSNLSVHCHPTQDYMRQTFGWDYTQHESYYIMETTPGAHVFLGLRPDADPDAFHSAARAADDDHARLSVDHFVNRLPARQHQLYLIPAGTPHASSAGNVVLEISATPYLYSLRFYDWLRTDLDGHPRPVHVGHAFANLDTRVDGAHLPQLVQEPIEVRRDDDVVEWRLGRHPDLFFAVHRLDFRQRAHDDTNERFHVLNLVEGGRVDLRTERDRHRLSFGETLVVPAAVGPYEIVGTGDGPYKLVKAFVRPSS